MSSDDVRIDPADPTRRGRDTRLLLDSVATFAIVAASGTLVWFLLTRGPGEIRRPDPTIPDSPVAITGAATLGDETARTVLLVYSDFFCPFCSRFAQAGLPILKARLIEQGHLQVVFRHLPLDRLHPDAPRAALIAQCAVKHERFWQAHDMLFANPQELVRGSSSDVAGALGIVDGDFTSCLSSDGSGEALLQIKSDTQEALGMGLTGTPAFAVGRRQADGKVQIIRALRALPVDELVEVVEGITQEDPLSRSR